VCDAPKNADKLRIDLGNIENLYQHMDMGQRPCRVHQGCIFRDFYAVKIAITNVSSKRLQQHYTY